MLRDLTKNKEIVCCHEGQITIEFTFSMIILMIMIYSIIRIFMWSGLNVGNTQKAHESQLMTNIDEDYVYVAGGVIVNGPLLQVQPIFQYHKTMNALWR